MVVIFLSSIHVIDIRICMKDMFILSEIWAQHDIYIYIGRHFSWLKYFTHPLVPVLAPNYKQHSLSSAKHIKVGYSLAELYVKSLYFNLFWWRGT
jgi:hypothetical protein